MNLNVDSMKNANGGRRGYYVNHFTIDKDKVVQLIMVEKILETMKKYNQNNHEKKS